MSAQPLIDSDDDLMMGAGNMNSSLTASEQDVIEDHPAFDLSDELMNAVRLETAESVNDLRLAHMLFEIDYLYPRSAMIPVEDTGSSRGIIMSNEVPISLLMSCWDWPA